MAYYIKIGKKVRIAATLKDSNGVKVQDAVTWSTSDAAVATVDAAYTRSTQHPITGAINTYSNPIKADVHKATVLGVGAGTATITVTQGIVTQTSTVTVSAGTAVASMENASA